MQTAIAVLLFIAGLVLLIKGGDWFVDGSVNIAHRTRLPEMLIGSTIVAIGTTLPEVMVSSLSAFREQSATAYGNAIGSVICNAALIAALTIAIRPVKADRSTFRLPVLFFFLAAALYTAVSYFGNFRRWVGILLLAMFAAYMILSARSAFKKAAAGTGEPAEKEPDEIDEEAEPEAVAPQGALWKDILLLVAGAAAIAVGAYLLVNYGKEIAIAMGVPESVIAITLIALGTSLPELATAVISLIKGHASLSLGNIIGANLFNLVLVSGAAVTIRPFNISEATAQEAKTILGHPSSRVVEIPLMLLSMLILTVPPLIKGKVFRWQGVLLLLLYAGFCVYQFAF
ncbi:MAG: calcium/sodium antiporter [Clostridia bacterium]|nr:calcium/sodium antiporter [Clostridia bacterium]